MVPTADSGRSIEDSILERFDHLNVWARGGERAPHKPLLALLALAEVSRGHREPLRYPEVAPKLRELLRDFGPSRPRYHPENPFWHLQNDGIWAVALDGPLPPSAANRSPSHRELSDCAASGTLDPETLSAISASPTLLRRIAERLLDCHFPESCHDDILGAIGLDLDFQLVRRRPRDARFPARILVAYERRCAVCNLDVRLGGNTIGLEAAHIKWHQAGGPDEETNGLALCALHHKTFDRGAFTIFPGNVLVVSEQVSGSSGFEELLMQYHGKPIRSPIQPEHQPSESNLEWHRSQVFKQGPRPLSTDVDTA